jgi:hypothetical protein
MRTDINQLRGLDVNSESGQLFGVPTAAGSFTLALGVGDEVVQYVEKTVTLIVE